MLPPNRLGRVSNLGTSSRKVKLLSSLTLPKYAHLILQLVKRDFRMRFTGSALGVFWAILQPLSLVVLYWFVFTYMIPQSKVAGKDEYVYFLISGLIPWIGINEGIVRGTTSIVDNAAVVRRLPFRSEVLVLVPNASAMIFELIGLALFLIFAAANGVSLWNLWLLPFALVIQFALQLGVAWLMAPAYVFFRDVSQLLGFALPIIFYLSPILYPVTGKFEKFFRWNPMTPLLGLFRGAVLSKPLPDASSIVFLLIVASVVFSGGLLFFRRAQPTLVDLI
jgi:lipopolysaccharide transport system permease protein